MRVRLWVNLDLRNWMKDWGDTSLSPYMGTMRDSVVMYGTKLLHFTGCIKGISQLNLKVLWWLLRSNPCQLEQCLGYMGIVHLFCVVYVVNTQKQLNTWSQNLLGNHANINMTGSWFIFTGCYARGILWSIVQDGGVICFSRLGKMNRWRYSEISISIAPVLLVSLDLTSLLWRNVAIWSHWLMFLYLQTKEFLTRNRRE